MKVRIIGYVGLLILSYYMIYVGLVGAKVPINYGYIPSSTTGYALVSGYMALAFVGIGGLLFAFTYLHLSEYYKFKHTFMSSRHCEKTSFLAVGMVLLTLYFVYLMGAKMYNYPIEWFYLSLMGVVGGYAGVIFYRVMHKKPVFSLDTFKFWSAKS